MKPAVVLNIFAKFSFSSLFHLYGEDENHLSDRGLILDMCVQRTRMPPPCALSEMVPWLRYWLLSDYYRSMKADLYNVE